MPLGQKDEMSQNTYDIEHNHLNIIPLSLAFLTISPLCYARAYLRTMSALMTNYHSVTRPFGVAVTRSDYANS